MTVHYVAGIACSQAISAGIFADVLGKAMTDFLINFFWYNRRKGLPAQIF